jgi:transposase
MCYELTDHEWSAIKPMLPNEVRGVRRVDDRRVLNGIFWVLRSGAPWRDLPQEFGPYTCKAAPVPSLHPALYRAPLSSIRHADTQLIILRLFSMRFSVAQTS